MNDYKLIAESIWNTYSDMAYLLREMVIVRDEDGEPVETELDPRLFRRGKHARHPKSEKDIVKLHKRLKKSPEHIPMSVAASMIKKLASRRESGVWSPRGDTHGRENWDPIREVPREGQRQT